MTTMSTTDTTTTDTTTGSTLARSTAARVAAWTAGIGVGEAVLATPGAVARGPVTVIGRGDHLPAR